MAGLPLTRTGRDYRLEGFDSDLISAILDTAYRKDVEARGGNLIAVADFADNVDKVAAWLTGHTRKNSLLLTGGVGCGKTTFLRAICDTLEKVRAAYFEQDQKVKATDPKLSNRLFILGTYVPYPALKTAASWAKTLEDSPDMLELIRERKFVLIDDLGTEPAVVKVYGTETTPLRDIIMARHEDMTPTVITTNLTPENIRERYGERVWDRMRETYATIAFTNKSYRGR